MAALVAPINGLNSHARAILAEVTGLVGARRRLANHARTGAPERIQNGLQGKVPGGRTYTRVLADDLYMDADGTLRRLAFPFKVADQPRYVRDEFVTVVDHAP